MLVPMFQGFMLGASLIMPIGAQNAYVLSRGIRRQHHLLVASLCLFCDLVLILIGVFGGGRWLGSVPFSTSAAGVSAPRPWRIMASQWDCSMPTPM